MVNLLITEKNYKKVSTISRIKRNVYELGGSPEIDMVFTDQNDEEFVPNKIRLTVEYPDGSEITVSGGTEMGGTDIVTASGYLYYLVHPETRGWYQYEVWGKDSTGREIVKSNGFEVTDLVIN